MPSRTPNSFGAQATLSVDGRRYEIFRLKALEEAGLTQLARLPFSIRVLLENALRNEDGARVTADHVRSLAAYDAARVPAIEIPYLPARVVMQDFTGVPAVVDLAALRDAMRAMGGDPAQINPLVRADLVIDHSVQVDSFGTADALQRNVDLEYARNRERYVLLRWAQESFRNFNVVPPGIGIVHQDNLERLATVVATDGRDGMTHAYPDTLVGTDSHTTMINGLGVMGWGVGGIEAEAVLLGQPYAMLLPEVVGFKLLGRLPVGATATDLVLTVTEMLRRKGVVGKFVEFFGPGLDHLTVADRATLANMAPEYGATMGFFPVDDATLQYLRLTGRPTELLRLIEAYLTEQELFRTAAAPDPAFSATVELDMGQVRPCLAGPKRPQDRVPLASVQRSFRAALLAPPEARGFGLPPERKSASVEVTLDDVPCTLTHGTVVIAAITSCTNTSNPSVMLAAGLLAAKALDRGLRTRAWVKTSLAPGSRVVTDYLRRAGLLAALEAQRFHLVGYGCTTCIGNSGPLPAPIETGLGDGGIIAASVLSGNRNFEGRIHAAVKANYLASPPLVVAYALAGRIDIDVDKEPLGAGADGAPVFLRDIWPSEDEIRAAVEHAVTPAMFRARYDAVFEGDAAWRALPTHASETFAWDPASTYIKAPPFFLGIGAQPPPVCDIEDARVLALLGDSVTTDHISPAGAIPPDGPAGVYLQAHGVAPDQFNSFGSRRGNHEVMLRGAFAGIRLRNLLLPGTEGGVTVHFPSGEHTTIYDAAMRYAAEDTPLVIIAGREYGTGSSRDWAAKGAALLGVKAVIAESFERIHRSNLVGMGVLPLQFADGQCARSLELTGAE